MRAPGRQAGREGVGEREREREGEGVGRVREGRKYMLFVEREREKCCVFVSLLWKERKGKVHKNSIYTSD